jgi:hypothetical protein
MDTNIAEEDTGEGTIVQSDISSWNRKAVNQDSQPQASDTVQQGQTGGTSGKMKEDVVEIEQNAAAKYVYLPMQEHVSNL